MPTPPFTQVTIIDDLRTGSGFTIGEIYYTTDTGQEGFWRYLGEFYNSGSVPDPELIDNTGLTLTNPIITDLFNTDLRKVFKRVYDGYVYVNWFGAKADSSTDNTDAIQLAVDSLRHLGGGALYFNEGDYLTRTIEINGTPLAESDKVYIIGAGQESTRIVGYSRLKYAGYIKTDEPATASIPNPLVELQIPIFRLSSTVEPNATAYLKMMDLSVVGIIEEGNYISVLGGDVFYIDCGYTYNGIEAYYQTRFEIGSIEIKACEICFYGEGCISLDLHDFNIGGPVKETPRLSSNYGIRLKNSEYYAANMICIKNGTISCCKKTALEFQGGNMLNITEVVFEANGNLEDNFPVGGIVFKRPLNDAMPDITGGNYVSIININNCWFENNQGYTIYLPDPEDEETIDNIIINLSNSFFAKMISEHSNGVYLGLINLPAYESPSYIAKVNISGIAARLPNFEIVARETISNGSYIENFIVNGSAHSITGTPGYVVSRNYLLDQ